MSRWVALQLHERVRENIKGVNLIMFVGLKKSTGSNLSQTYLEAVAEDAQL